MMKTELSWAEVHKTHKTIAGIFVRDGLAVSLLCDPRPKGHYRNSITKTKIEYRVDSQTQTRGVLALIASVEKKNPLTVFQKMATNVWANLGSWSVSSVTEETETGTALFTLTPAK